MLGEYSTVAFTIYAKSASISKASLFERAYVLLEFGQLLIKRHDAADIKPMLSGINHDMPFQAPS